MNAGRSWTLGVGAVLGVLAWLTWAILVSGDTRQSVRLPDGSTLCLEQIDYGRSHTFRVGFPGLDFLRKALPASLRRVLPPGGEASTEGDRDTLVPWFSRQNTNGAWIDPDAGLTRIVDEHGCSWPIGWQSHARAGDAQLCYTRVEAFPRRARQFRMAVRQGTNEVWFTVKNRWRFEEQPWQPEPLPATRTDQGLAVTLENLKVVRTDDGRVYADPRYTLSENGTASKTWKNEQTRFTDALGNVSTYARGLLEPDVMWVTFNPTPALCPYEPVWKVEAWFRRTAEAAFTPEELWSIPELDLPKEGAAVRLDLTNRLQGVQLEAACFFGPGEIQLSNHVLIGSRPLRPGSGWGFSTSTRSQGGQTTESITQESTTAGLALAAKGLQGNQRVLVFLSFPDGGKVSQESRGRSVGDMRFYRLKWPSNQPRANLHIVVDTTRKAEFLVKPPRP